MVMNINIPGARPKDIMSAKESKSLPMGDVIPISRAVKPSKKSKTMAMMRQIALISKRPKKASMMAKMPKSPLAEVSKLGKLNNFMPFWCKVGRS